VPAGLAEHRDRDLHPRADEQAVAHGHAQPGVGTARVADRRDAELDRRQQVPRRLVKAVGERPVLHRELVVLVRARQVDVGVEQAGQHGLARAVDALVAVEPGTDLDDPVVLDRHIGIGERRHRPVEDLPAMEHRPRHQAPLSASADRTLQPRAEPDQRVGEVGGSRQERAV
jgi:hypothetical protein